MFSSRTPPSLALNRLAQAAARRRAAGEPFIDLTESNPTRVGLEYPDDFLAPLSDSRGLVYDPHPRGLAAARAAVAADYARRGISVAPERIVLAASTSEAYAMLFKLLCDPGDHVLVPQPSYPLIDHLARFEAVRIASYPLALHDDWRIDFDALDRAFGWDTRAVLVVSPNNPTGSHLVVSDLEALAARCRDRASALVGDEVFTDYPLDPPLSGAAATVLSQDCVLAFSLGGFSKTIGSPQLKLAWAAVGGPDRLVDEALARLDVINDAYLSVATPIQLASPTFFERGAAVRAAIHDRVRANYRTLQSVAAAHPTSRVLRAHGGWYAVVQVPATRSEEALVLTLLEHDDVLVHPGYFFDFPREAFLIVSLLPPPQIFDEGVARIFARASI